MKKYIIFIFSFIFIFIFMIGCKKSYQITYDLDGGICSDLITSFDSFENVYLNSPTKEGHTFLGWYNDNELVTKIEKNQDYFLKAKWEIISFTISYDLDGGICSDLVNTFNYFDDVVLPVPSKENYIFLGWYEDESKVDEILRKNYSLKAKWELIPEDKILVRGFFQNELIYNEKVSKDTRLSELDFLKNLDNKYTYNIKEVATSSSFDTFINLNRKVSSDIDLYFELNIKPVKSLDNSVVSILGDSISTFYTPTSAVVSYYNVDNSYYYPKYCSSINSYTKTWWAKTIEGINGVLGINNSYSGSCTYNWNNENNNSAMNMHRINTLGENGIPDIIIIFMGTNDVVNNFSHSIFRNAYDKMLTRITNKYPYAYIFCLNLGYSAYPGYEDERLNYNEIISDCANKHKAVLVNIASIQTKDTYLEMLADRLHPNENGMNKISERVITVINSFYNNGKIFK